LLRTNGLAYSAEVTTMNKKSLMALAPGNPYVSQAPQGSNSEREKKVNFISCTNSTWCHNTRHKDTQPNDTQHNNKKYDPV